MPFVGGDNVVVRQVGDSNWALVEPLVYRGNRETFTAPSGFETDFASVPRALVWLIPRYGRYTKAAILHDYLWRTGVVPRVDANGLFRRVMRELGVPALRRWMMWAAVGLGSVVKDPGGELRPGWRHVTGLVLVALPATVFVAVPFVVVTVWLGLDFLVESAALPIAWVWNRLRPLDRRKEVNRPRFEWKLS